MHPRLYKIILFRSSTTTVSTTNITDASSLPITTTKISESEPASDDSIEIEENNDEDDQRIYNKFDTTPFINCFKHLKKRATRSSSSTSSLLNDDTEGDNAISIQQHLIGVKKISLEKLVATTTF